MKSQNSHFSGKDLNKLIEQRKRVFLIGIPSLIVLFALIFYICTNGPDVSRWVILGIIIFFLLPLILIGNYSLAVTEAAYHIIADNSGWKIYYDDSKFNHINKIYQNIIKNFGLLDRGGHVNFDNRLEGEIENYKFIMQDVSWNEPKRSKYGRRNEIVAEYFLLILDNTFNINCNILIKKNKILKWGISKLKRIKIEDKEFEKYYDAYTDDPATALTVLNPEFIRNLLYYKQVRKNHVEILITPKNIFLHQKPIENEERLNWNIFIHPMDLCQRKIEKINEKFNTLSLLNLLNNK